MHQNELETPVDSIGNGVIAVKGGRTGLRHDGAIQGGNGVAVARGPAKQGQYH